MTKIIALLIFSFITSTAFADGCPSIKDLQSNKTANWKAFDSDDDKPLSAVREAKLRNAIAHFAMAEWKNSHDKSVIHCYYNDQHGSAMEAYFAKNSSLPMKSSKYWYPVTGMMQCVAGADKCQFQALPEMGHQLASKEP